MPESFGWKCNQCGSLIKVNGFYCGASVEFSKFIKKYHRCSKKKDHDWSLTQEDRGWVPK